MKPELPAHQALVHTGVCDGLACGPAAIGAELGGLRASLVAGLAPIATTLDAGAEVCVDRYWLRRALAGPSGRVSEPFAWTAPFAARSLGLVALGCMLQEAGLKVSDALCRAIDDEIAEDRSLGRWLVALGAPERGATMVAAATWMARAWVAVPWRHLGTVHLRKASTWVRPLGQGAPVVVKGRPDAAITPPGRRPGERVLLWLGAPDPALARLYALASTLSSGVAPLRVVSVEASSGIVDPIDVDMALLRSGVDQVVVAAARLAEVCASSVDENRVNHYTLRPTDRRPRLRRG